MWHVNFSAGLLWLHKVEFIIHTWECRSVYWAYIPLKKRRNQLRIASVWVDNLLWGWLATVKVSVRLSNGRSEMDMTSTNWYNVIVLGAGFLLLFSAFQTTAFVQVTTDKQVFCDHSSNLLHYYAVVV